MSEPTIDAGAADGEPPRPRALVIDDDRAIRSLAGTVLRRGGFIVDDATNGRDAFALVRTGTFYDVIVLDLMMPDMNGFEFIDELRSLDARALDRIVVITASVHLARRGMPEDICHVLLKPFDLADFQAAVTKCLADSRSARS